MLTAEDQETFDKFKAELLATLEWVKTKSEMIITTQRFGVVWDMGPEADEFRVVPVATPTIQTCAVCLLGAHTLRLLEQEGGAFHNPIAFNTLNSEFEELREDNGDDTSVSDVPMGIVLDALLGLTVTEIDSFVLGFDDELLPGWGDDAYYALGQELRPLALATNTLKEVA